VNSSTGTSDTVLMTGANRGIGLALTERLLQAGHRVIATCRRPADADVLTALGASNEGGRLEILSLDVGDATSVDALAATLADRPIDALVNNAGRMRRENGVDDLDYEDWATTLAINTIAPVRIASALKPNLLLAPGARLLCVSSQMGSLERATSGNIAYRSSKAALNMAMRCLADEWRAEGIAVVMVHPGWVRTDMGGEDAPLAVSDSAAGLARLVERVTMADTGRFLDHDGSTMPW